MTPRFHARNRRLLRSAPRLRRTLAAVFFTTWLLGSLGCRALPNSGDNAGTGDNAATGDERRFPVVAELAATVPISPSNYRPWIPKQARLPSVEFDGTRVKVHDVRNFDYVTETDHVERFETRNYDLRELESVDYMVVPFPAAPLLAHTMLSFGFGRGRYLVSSVEARLEQGETYSPLLGGLRQYELIYVLADERDALRLRADVRGDDVYIYRVQAPPEKLRDLLVDILDRVNQLRDTPEFYDTLTNNCTTNIARHVNRIAPARVPLGSEVLLSGLSPRLIYDLGLLDSSRSFEDLTLAANASPRIRENRTASDFSDRIRR
jgi:hypothetical protein